LLNNLARSHTKQRLRLDTNIRDEFRKSALDELVKREELDVLNEIARDTNIRDEFRRTAFEGIKKSKK
jgi:hypothetical protein